MIKKKLCPSQFPLSLMVFRGLGDPFLWLDADIATSLGRLARHRRPQKWKAFLEYCCKERKNRKSFKKLNTSTNLRTYGFSPVSLRLRSPSQSSISSWGHEWSATNKPLKPMRVSSSLQWKKPMRSISPSPLFMFVAVKSQDTPRWATLVRRGLRHTREHLRWTPTMAYLAANTHVVHANSNAVTASASLACSLLDGACMCRSVYAGWCKGVQDFSHYKTRSKKMLQKPEEQENP